MWRQTPNGHVMGIVILGGFHLDSHVASVLDGHGASKWFDISSGMAERIMEAVRISKLYPEAKILYSGGGAEGQLGKKVLMRLGVANERIIIEDQSQNTAENGKIVIALVVGLHWGYSLLAAVLTLSVLAIPYITKSTESALSQVPSSYREGAEALGMPVSWTLRRVVLKTAMPGIITGLLVAIAISVGETAPLLYTAHWSAANPTGQLTHSPVGYLTYLVFAFSPLNQPYQSANDLSYDAALILVRRHPAPHHRRKDDHGDLTA